MFGADRLARIAWAFVGLGIVIRTIRFLLDFPLWPDEAYLAHNYLDRGYLDLLRALDYGQVAPLLYLWVQKTVVAICGFSEYSLRLYAFLGSIASLLLFRHLAGRLLQGIARLMAIGTFAVAYPLIRYSAEAKPYGSDMLVTLLLLVLLVEWRLERQKTRWLWALAVAMPAAVLLSYPAMFVVPAISLAMLIELFRSGTRRQWLAWLGVNVATAGGVALLFFASARAQIEAAGPHMRTGWEQAFPPLQLGQANGAVPLGKPHQRGVFLSGRRRAGRSSLTTLCWLTALVLLVRRRRFWLATLFTLPLALNFTAAALHAYPYAGHSRVMLYMAPIFCLLTGLGAAAILSVMKNRRWSVGRTGGRGLGAPGSDRKHRFRSRFSQAVQGNVLAAEPRFRPLVLDRQGPWTPSWSASAPIASSRFPRRRAATTWHRSTSAISGSTPAGMHNACRRNSSRSPRTAPCAAPVSGPRLPRSRTRPGSRQWLRSMEAKYRLVAREKYPLTFFVHEHELQYVDQVEMYEFVPVEQRMASAAAGTGADGHSARMAGRETRPATDNENSTILVK